MRRLNMVQPLVLFAVTYILGIVIADSFRITVFSAALLASTALVLHLFATYKREHRKTVSAAILFLSLGIFLTALSASGQESSLLYKAGRQSAHATIEGYVTGDPTYQEGVSSFNLKATAYHLDGLAADDRQWRINEEVRVKVRSRGRLKLGMGDGIRVSGRFGIPKSSGDFDYRRYLYHKGIMSTLSAHPDDIEHIQHQDFSLIPYIMSYAGSIRRWVKGVNSSYLPPDCAGLLNGIVLGDMSTTDDEIEESFRSTGLTHILAASGMNIALVLGALWPLLRILRLRPPVQFGILVAFSALYTMVSGMSPSITRAFVMATIALIAWLFGRGKDGLTSLAAAVLAILVVSPFTLFDIGFQLSFIATASLIMFASRFDRLMSELPKALRTGLSVTIAAQLGVLPIMVYYFGQVSAISPIANLIVVPLTGPALVLGMVALPVAAISKFAGALLFFVVKIILEAMIHSASMLSKIPGASLSLGQPSLLMVLLSYPIIAGLALYFEKINLKLRLWHALLLLIGLVTASIWWQVALVAPPAGLEIEFLDVGQGDSALITAPDGTRLLIDGGPDPGTLQKKLEQRGIKKIDAVLISHFHADHAGGLKKLADVLVIGSIIYPHSTKDSKACSALFAGFKGKGSRDLPVDAGDTLRLGNSLEIDTLYTELNDSAPTDDENDESAVVMVKYGKFKALFTGDAGEDIEKQLVGEDSDIDA
ncbi:MAG: DNA internalization-related competence protein ComEC/Rec2, partial [Candidatus Aquicultor sp.]